MRLKPIAAALVLLGSLAVSQPAAATISITSFTGNPGFLYGSINYVPSGLVKNVGVGRLELIGTQTPGNSPVDFLTFCVDIFNGLHAGQFEVSPLSTIVPNATKQTQLLALLSNANPLIGAAATLEARKNISAGIQLAVWDIVNEQAITGYSLANGDFRASGTELGAALTLAGAYLSNVTSGTWTPTQGSSLGLLYARDNQSQIYLPGVPEPATWAMMIGGFGLVGAAVRRRRTRVRYQVA